MRRTLRTKLFAILASTALAFIVVIVASEVVNRSVTEQLVRIEQRQIPKLELGPQLEAELSALRRAYQDAVAAHDPEALERTRDARDRLLARLAKGDDVVDPAASAAFRAALLEYHDAAIDVSRRMMTGEGGESMVEAIALMQKRQAHAVALLERVTAFDQADLKGAFGAARAAQRDGGRQRFAIALVCLGVVLALSLWFSRSVVRAVAGLQEGFARFGKGRLDEPIEAEGNDELSDVAMEANRMAESLANHAALREERDWIKTGLMELTADLRGELDKAEVAKRAARSLSRYLDARAAAVYAVNEDRTTLDLLGYHALNPGGAPGEAAPSFAMGEGLVGEAALASALVVIDDPPPDFLRVRSGLGEGAPRAIVLAPLVHDGKVAGVIELAFFKPVSPSARELLLAARATVAITLEVAQSRAAARELLERAQKLAARLQAQEEELRSTNEELRCQQEELRQANDELSAHAQELARQRLALQAKNTDLESIGRRLEQKATELTTVSSYKSQFLANMSHELRTPLNSMLLLSQLLSENTEGNLTPKQLEYTKTVHGAGKDLLLLINQVLDLAKVEAGKQEIKADDVRLEDLADRVRRVFAPLAREKGLELLVGLTPGLPETISSDGLRIGQILTNLVGNAIKFTERGQVKVTIGRPLPSVRLRAPHLQHEKTIAFSVSDTGVGVPKADQERIFAPFEQVDGSTQRRQGGTGLGLSISREFTSLLGGELQLESSPGAGSTFVCYLPEQLGSVPTGATATKAIEPAANETPVQPSEVHLLVIEDDPVFAEILGQIIQERGLVHLTARDGKTGLRMARDHRPHGIILDVKLPDTNGWKVMEELRANPSTASIPVHFISGVEMPERGLAMGAAGYLTKPADRQALVGVVESLGPKRDRASHRILVVEDDAALGETLVEQLAAEGLVTRRASSARDALDILKRESFACMVVDMSVADLDELELLDVLKKRGESDPPPAALPAIVLYSSRPLSRAEATRLDSYAEAVVLSEGASTDRLLDEIRLFVRRLEAGLPRRALGGGLHAGGVRLGGKKVLVVDDDMRTVYALSATLRAKGAEVLVAETGAVALAVLGDNPDVHAVLMDMMMPEMDGYEASRRIKKQPRFEALPIVALTAKAMKGDRERCLEAGATDYLPKPIDADALLSLLAARLGVTQGA